MCSRPHEVHQNRYSGIVTKKLLRASVGAAVIAGAVLATASLPAAQASQDILLPNARTIVDRYVAAMGGDQAFARVTSVHATGSITVPQQGISGTADLLTARPNKSLL